MKTSLIFILILSWQRYLRRHNITGYTAPIYHQRANPVEKRNQEIKKALRIQNQDQPIDRWDENLHEITFNLHNRKNAATGMSPSQALLGAQLVKPGEWNHPVNQQPVHNDAREREARIEQAHRRKVIFERKYYTDPRDAPVHFIRGDQVLVRQFPGTSTAFCPTWTGPHTVAAVLGDNVYEIDRNGVQYQIHVDDIRPAPTPMPEQGHLEAPEDDDIRLRPIPWPARDTESEADEDEPPTVPVQSATGRTNRVTIEDLLEDDDHEDPRPIQGPQHITGLWP
ncbi:hypothetical protein NQ314_015725 [Rhamnusium bicolor]|uniref:Integrase catalytic domain-containing protein n=1 Tax=Rhamnusium bicolor TaxID=1586634 RepID=A0AAV8WYQ1_9CUCU|nr:hypothetical protein NQ314_015725 [Rhamnusium bicolor]